jgi:hypothetical protein
MKMHKYAPACIEHTEQEDYNVVIITQQHYNTYSLCHNAKKKPKQQQKLEQKAINQLYYYSIYK